MESKKLSDYEKKRLENIRRNGEMFSSLKLHSLASELNASTKLHRKTEAKRKAKDQNPIAQRESSRTRGIAPEFEGIIHSSNPKSPTEEQLNKRLAQKSGRVDMKEAYNGYGSDRAVIEAILRMGSESEPKLGEDRDGFEGSSSNSNCLALSQENSMSVSANAITRLKFFPCGGSRMVVAGDSCGDIVIWNVDQSFGFREEAINSYSPHSGPISGFSIHRHCLSKVFTSSKDGFISVMDIEKEAFDFFYSGEQPIYSLAQQPDDMKCLYFGEGQGNLNIWDERVGKCTACWDLHKMRVKSIDFNSQNPYIMATSSSDKTARIWDLRSINAGKPETLKTIRLKRVVQSAYFSPSGKRVAITSGQDRIDILGGVNFTETSTLKNFNKQDKSFPGFSAIWGWDDSHVFIGSSAKRVDTISLETKSPILSLGSPYVSDVPCKLEAHPYSVGTLAAAASTRGVVYVWMWN